MRGTSKLLILGPSYRRNLDPNPLPAIKRYDGLFYRIVRKYMDAIKGKVDILIVTEDLELITPETPLPYKPPRGDKWKDLRLEKIPEAKQRELQDKLISSLRSGHYDEVFIALNKHYRGLLPDLKPYVRRVLADFRGLGSKAEAIKKWIIED